MRKFTPHILTEYTCIRYLVTTRAAEHGAQFAAARERCDLVGLLLRRLDGGFVVEYVVLLCTFAMLQYLVCRLFVHVRVQLCCKRASHSGAVAHS